MGTDWRPKGEYGNYIERLMRESIQERETKKMDVREQAEDG
jgi:hypothetical protein